MSSEVLPTTGIAPGSAFATMELHAYLLDVCVPFLATWPLLSLSVYVDDMSFSSCGASVRHVVWNVVQGWAWLIEEVQNRLRLPFSLPETQLLCDSAVTMAAVRTMVGDKYGNVVLTIRRLGFDYALSSKVRWKPVAAKRMGKFLSRCKYIRKKYPSLRSASLFHAGLLPSVAFGADLVPMGTAHIKRLRSEGLKPWG